MRKRARRSPEHWCCSIPPSRRPFPSSLTSSVFPTLTAQLSAWTQKVASAHEGASLSCRYLLDLDQLVDDLLEFVVAEIELAPQPTHGESPLFLQKGSRAAYILDEAHNASSLASRSACPVAPISV